MHKVKLMTLTIAMAPVLVAIAATWSRARVVSDADANEDLLTADERVDAEHGMNGPKSEEEMIRKRIERI